MIAHETPASLWPAVPLLAAGFVLGRGYFAMLRHCVRLFAAHHGWSRPLLLTLGRIAAATLFFAFAVRWGLPALLAAFVGFLVARHIAVRSARRLA